jgi:predicted glycoside hydrolase/deacetylase ChbG (UPF0249 family)
VGAIFIINADDLGVSRGATLGIVRAHIEGVVTSASLSPTGADYCQAVKITRESCPNLGIGLHFTLSVGKPISPPSEVPLLIDGNGDFRWEFVSLLKTLRLRRSGALLTQIEIELEAQIQKLFSDGVSPDHINSERHVHLIPGIFDKVILAASRHNIPFVRAGSDLGPGLVGFKHFRTTVFNGGILKFMLLQSLTHLNKNNRQQVMFCNHFASYVFTGRLDLILKQVLDMAPDGVTEVMVHPGIPEESRDANLGNPGLENYLTSENRRQELEACVEAKSLVDQLDLCSFRTLALRHS